MSSNKPSSFCLLSNKFLENLTTSQNNRQLRVSIFSYSIWPNSKTPFDYYQISQPQKQEWAASTKPSLPLRLRHVDNVSSGILMNDESILSAIWRSSSTLDFDYTYYLDILNPLSIRHVDNHIRYLSLLRDALSCLDSSSCKFTKYY